MTEHQLRWRLFDHFHFMAEFKVNEFLDDANDYGVGIGVAYRI